MLIKVQLLKGYKNLLLYKIPETWKGLNLVGSIIKVPLRNSKVLALIEEIVEKKETNFELKFPYSIEDFPKDPLYLIFINKLSYYYQIEKTELIGRLQQFILKKSKKTKIDHQISNEMKKVSHKEIFLTEEQQQVYEFVKQKIKISQYSSTLLHGVTGSGKTEVYKKLITFTILEQKKSVIFLLPEISLALQFEQNFKNTLDGIKILSFHSAINEISKKELWQSLLNNEPVLIIGVHMPILLPISNLGLIIVDEEHDIGYQEKKHPKINSKEAAILRAQLNNIPILLGSATPSINSLHNIKHKKWNFFQLKQRFSGSFSEIKIVKLNKNRQRKNFWISKELENSINETLNKKEQIIIFLNRRGYSFFIQCKECNFVFKCKNCSVSLTLHQNNWLYCHYCGLKAQYPKNCIQCKANEDKFIKKGIGTEQVVNILEKLFPNISIARADLDSTKNKKKWNQTLNNFKESKIDILVGTQTITKGYHFPNVTLVGILWADLNLHFPIFNSSEITLQQLIQVAGRAGRQIKDSKVIVQTMIEHKIFDYINEVDYINFYNKEICERKLSYYPPYIRLAEIELKHQNELIVEHEALKLTKNLLSKNKSDVKILGPVKPIIGKLKNQNFQKIYFKSTDINKIINLFKSIDKNDYKSKIFFTPNPIN